MGVSTSPAQRCRRRSTPSRRVDDVAGEPSKLQGAGAPKSSFGSVKNHSTKALGLVLRAKDMITMLLYGLEVFLSMCGKSSNSSKHQMAGGCHIYRPPSRGAVAPTVSKNLRTIG